MPYPSHYPYPIPLSYDPIPRQGRTSEAITKLLRLTPDTATVVTLDADGGVTSAAEVAAELVHKGDVLKVGAPGRVGWEVWGRVEGWVYIWVGVCGGGGGDVVRRMVWAWAGRTHGTQAASLASARMEGSAQPSSPVH